MTVAELIQKLQTLPGQLMVVEDFDGQYADVGEPHIIKAWDDNGQVLRVSVGWHVALAQEYVVI